MFWDDDQLFENAYLYDLAFSWDLRPETTFFKKLFPNCGNLLVPACGTGRHAFWLAQEGYQIGAFDIQSSMLAFALTNRRHNNIHYYLDDMTTMLETRKDYYDGGLLLNNSFRYILNKDKAIQHLQHIAMTLKEKSHYLIEVGLNDNASLIGKSIKWSIQHDDMIVHANWTMESFDPPLSVDHVEIQMENICENKHIIEWQPQLTWTFDEITFAINKTPFKLETIFNTHQEKILNWESISEKCGKYYLLLKKETLS